MFPKFNTIQVGTKFVANKTLYLKTSAFTFVEVLNESMGEQTISPFIEDRIDVTPEAVFNNTDGIPTFVAHSDDPIEIKVTE